MIYRYLRKIAKRKNSVFQPVLFHELSKRKRLLLIIQRIIIRIVFHQENKPRKAKFKCLSGIYIRSNNNFLSALRRLGIWETELQHLFCSFLPSAKTFFDIGTMEGFYSVVAKKINPDIKIVGIEPSDGANEKFFNNFKLNNISTTNKIEFKPGLLSTERGENQYLMEDLIANEKQPIFILMDIEGLESSLLKSNNQLIVNKKLIFIIETHSYRNENDCIEVLQNAGYKTKIVKQARWRQLIPEERVILHNRWIYATNI